jgi:hypothetical protein
MDVVAAGDVFEGQVSVVLDKPPPCVAKLSETSAPAGVPGAGSGSEADSEERDPLHDARERRFVQLDPFRSTR